MPVGASRSRSPGQEAPEATEPYIVYRTRGQAVSDSRVRSRALMDSFATTLSRVIPTLYPEATLDDERYAELGYVLALTALYGHREMAQRKGLTMRNHDYGRLPTCGGHT